MNLNRAQTMVLTMLISSMLVLGSGCQSGGFKPDLGRLAFWKTDDIQLASREVPPPSAHFSPDRGDTEGVAKQNLKNSVDAIIAEAKRNKSVATDAKYKPYDLESINPSIGKSSETTNDFVGNNPLQNLKKSAATAIDSTQDALRQAGQIAQDPGSAISGVQQQSQHAASQIASGVSDGLARQANNIVTGAAGAANDFLNATSNKVQQTVNTVQESADNSFQPGGASSTSGLSHNPYLGALNDTTKDIAGAVADTGSTAKAVADDVAKAVNNVTLPPSNAPRYQMVTASTDATGNSSAPISQQVFDAAKGSGALQPLNNPFRTAQNTSVTSGQSQETRYPTTPFGSIQPVQQNSSSLPAALQSGSSSFTPGSTKPLQPLR